jgi:glycosyltransferase involved in cell wall biosynthesis
MRILVVSNAYEPSLSGVVTSIKTFRQALTAAGHEVFIFAPRYAHYTDTDPNIQRFPALDLTSMVDLSYAWPYRRRMIEAARALKPDLVHSQHPSVMGDRAVDIARALKISLIATMHCKYDDYARVYTPVLRAFISGITRRTVGKFVRQCDHIIVPAPNVQEWMDHTYSPSIPVSIVPTPIDIDLFKRNKTNVIEKTFGVVREDAMLYVGRLSAEKNLDFLVRSLPYILEKRPSTRLILVGKGARRRHLYHLAKKLKVADALILAGTAPGEDIPRLVASAGVFVFSSVIETQALSMIEAMAVGTPVVALDSPATRDVLSDGGGVLVPADEKAFANEVVALMDDRKRQKALGEQARKNASQYSIPETLKKLLTVYQSVVKKSRQK